MRENGVLRRVWLGVANTTVLWRVQSGIGWVSSGGRPQRLQDGSVLIPNARPVALGLGKPDGKPFAGAADLLGATEVTITPEMVGKRVPILTSIECKESGGGRIGDKQHDFRELVLARGGIAGIVSSPEEAQELIQEYLRGLLINE